MDGFYYLHTNGDLIFKKFRPEDDSPFVVKVWEIDTTDRGNAWMVAVDAGAWGARQDRIEELIKKWGLTNEDALNFIKYLNNRSPQLWELFLSEDRQNDCWLLTDTLNDHQVTGKRAIDALIRFAKERLKKEFH